MARHLVPALAAVLLAGCASGPAGPPVTINIAPTTTVPAPNVFGDGSYLVGVDLTPGQYRTDDADMFCYWERVSDFSGDPASVIAKGLEDAGMVNVQIRSGDYGFTVEGCGTWRRTS